MIRPRVLIGCCIGLFVAGAAADDFTSTSLGKLHKKFWDYEKAAHLLRRAGFGGSPEQVRKLVDMGLAAAVDSLVDYETIEWNIEPPPIAPLLLERPPSREVLRDLTEDERREFAAKRRRAQQRTFEEVRLWWIDRMVHSPRPFEEKMTLFWHGHFTSGYREVRNPIFMRDQNDLLRENAVGNFRDLLVGICKDRAMLVYLDNRSNVKRKPNENFARELMELFSLGVGNYTENDIKAAARAFTGWAFDRNGFVFRARQHDYGRKKFLGKSGKWNGLDIIDIILDHPACSRFLARNLLEFYCRPKPERRMVERLAGVIRKNDYDLKPVMKTLFMSRAFYHDDSRGSLVKSPVELLIGTARQLGVPINSLRQAERAMAAMGQEVMQPPNVKGWDGGAKWVNTAMIFNRYNFVSGLVYGGGRDRNRRDRAQTDRRTTDRPDEPSMMMMSDTMSPKSRIENRPQPPYDPLQELTENGVKSAEEIVDYYARHLLAVPLVSDKRQLLIDFLKPGSGKARRKSPGKAARVRGMIHLMMSTPEYQMN